MIGAWQFVLAGIDWQLGARPVELPVWACLQVAGCPEAVEVDFLRHPVHLALPEPRGIFGRCSFLTLSEPKNRYLF